jgi:hypothetical protein
MLVNILCILVGFIAGVMITLGIVGTYIERHK